MHVLDANIHKELEQIKMLLTDSGRLSWHPDGVFVVQGIYLVSFSEQLYPIWSFMEHVTHDININHDKF